ncbi:MAG: hypothetical protein K1X94_27085 [Sandaracinaceae bacterium]|nr:hypothetical protein [Sandaracinaceae bacterium]
MASLLRVAGLCAAIALMLGTRAVAATAALDAQSYEDVYYLPPPSWLPLLSLGHREALADLIWCRSLVYLGEEYAHQGGLGFVFDYTEAMLTLDPDFQAVYHWIATAGVYQPQEVTPEEIERSVAVMERGRERFPDDGQLAWELGATLSFELAPLLPAGPARDDARLRGAEHLVDASRLGAAPDWMVLSTTSQLASIGSAELAVQALEEMYASVGDEQVRTEIAARIASIRSEAYGNAFVEANDELERARVRRYPYVAPSLYFLLAPGPGESWDESLRLGYGHVLIDAISPPIEE